MNVAFLTEDSSASNSPLLVLPLFAVGTSLKRTHPALAPLNGELSEHLTTAANQEGFEGKAEQHFLFHTHGKANAERILLLGLGEAKAFTGEVLRLATGRAAKTAQKLKVSDVTLALPEEGEVDANVRAVVEGFLLGAYRFDRYRTSDKDKEAKQAPAVEKLRLGLPKGAKKSAVLDEAVELGSAVALATNWARDLVNEPASVITPKALAAEARAMGKREGLKVEVSGRREIEKLKLGMFLAVTQGSAEEPQLIRVTYTPKSVKHAKRPPLVLVGKAITFDSGGLSLKTAEGMVDMKTDMAGSAAVLGAMQVIAQLKPPFPVQGLMGACENMPSGTAYRPGDILTSRLGKTVEITNTDAEGRLVLGDMLTLAHEEKPAAIIDLATLTGACVVALGNYLTGVFGDDDALVDEVLTAARSAGEEMWRLPIPDAQKDALRSDVADMRNSGERWGAALNAAVFLREFVGKSPWVHLDIAGPSASPKERGYFGKGATGVGVRTLVDFVRSRAALTVE
jgi:leucyl aminopeptidase